MLQAGNDNMTIAYAHVNKGLIGHWSTIMKAPAKKKVVATSSDLSAVGGSGQTLILVWTLRSESADIDAPDVHA